MGSKSLTKKLEQAKPLLAVGMIGDCLKGNFFGDLQERAKEGDKKAVAQVNILQNPLRLQQKMRGLVRSLLKVREKFGAPGLVLDAVLVGSGAFGGTTKMLAQPFVDSLNVLDVPFDNKKDEVNFFMFPPPSPDEMTLEQMNYKARLNPPQGLGSEAVGNVVRVVVTGFDPVSLAPHGVVNRAFSAEGQISHATDLLHRITDQAGQFVNVQVPSGPAWESPAAFFAKEEKYKEEEGYDTVRFVPEVVLETLGIKGQEAQVQLVAKECHPPRAWNGDSFFGWTLSLAGGTPGKTWSQVVSSNALPCRLKHKRPNKWDEGELLNKLKRGLKNNYLFSGGRSTLFAK